MLDYEEIKQLLAVFQPDARLQVNSTPNVMLMWPVDGTRLFNFLVNRARLLEALKTGPKTELELFTRAGIPKWHIEYFFELKLKFS